MTGKMKKYTSKRNAKVEIVLNDEEKREILKLAKKEGLPVSTYVRWRILKSSI